MMPKCHPDCPCSAHGVPCLIHSPLSFPRCLSPPLSEACPSWRSLPPPWPTRSPSSFSRPKKTHQCGAVDRDTAQQNHEQGDTTRVLGGPPAVGLNLLMVGVASPLLHLSSACSLQFRVCAPATELGRHFGGHCVPLPRHRQPTPCCPFQ